MFFLNRNRISLDLSFRVLFLLAGALTICGCSCEKEPPAEDLSKAPPPLQIQKEFPRDLGVTFYPTLGATSPKPVVLVLGSDPSLCNLARERFEKKAHILCTSTPPESAGSKLKTALRYFKKSYPRYVEGPPVLLLTTPSHARAGWLLMLAEPGFFSHAYLEGLQSKVLTSTTLAALHRGPARTLVLGLNEDKRLQFLMNNASRHGLRIQPLTPGKDLRRKALDLLASAFLTPAPMQKL